MVLRMVHFEVAFLSRSSVLDIHIALTALKSMRLIDSRSSTAWSMRIVGRLAFEVNLGDTVASSTWLA